MIVDWDDWSIEYDPRERFLKLKEINPNFRMTLFTIPSRTSIEMLEWAFANKDWIELAIHGWTHEPNTECNDWTKERCLKAIDDSFFLNAKGFKAPGWQISDGCYDACMERGLWVADQPWNHNRRPDGLMVYQIPGEGAYHGHTWDCGTGNGIFEDWDNLVQLIKDETEFRLISEVMEAQYGRPLRR